MSNLAAYIDGVAVIAPGINSWSECRAILRGEQHYQAQKTIYPAAPTSLPPTERRRAAQVVKLALAIGYDALAQAQLAPDELPTVFASSGGDSYNCHEICQVLASNDRHISPTRFHNSVTNAAAGYWSIATRSMAPSTVVCAFDGSFSAGLLEAVAQVTVDNTRCMLLAYDVDYPEPLRSARPIPDGAGVALVLSPEPSSNSLAQIRVALSHHSADGLSNPALEELRMAIPAARALPLLEALAYAEAANLVLDYLHDLRLSVEVVPCRGGAN